MFKVIIADDEVRLCRLVQMLADWKALDMEVIGAASNGFEALALVETHAPDILITDIRMPGCDGLELIERARAVSPKLEIIIISGYAQFEYAQTAIRQGVSGYLLKPIQKEALMATLEETGKRLKERAASDIAMESLMLDKLRDHDLQRERLIDDLIHRRHRAKNAEQLEREYGILTPDALTRIALLKMDYERGQISELSLSLARKQAEELFSASVAPLCSACVLYFQGALAYVVLNYSDKRHEDVKHALRIFLNQLDAQKHLFGGMEFTLAIGSASASAQNLPDSFHEARGAICDRLVEGTGRMLEYRPKTSAGESRQLLDRYSRTIRRAIEALSRDEAAAAADELACEIEKRKDIYGFEILDLVLTAGKLFVLTMNAHEEERLLGELERRCDLCSSAKKLFECLKAFQDEQIEIAAAQRESETTRPIRIAKQYIGEHFNEPITLEDVCAATGFSASYFSTIFKKETGEGFAKYLARMRIEHAKTLLQETNLSVAEICEQVGYSDIKHFTGTFKKTTSLNPGQYRRLYG